MNAIPTCCITGRIAGDPMACGDCDPCGAAHLVPQVVKDVMKERDDWANKYSDAMTELDGLRQPHGSAQQTTDPLYDSRNPNHGRSGGLRIPAETDKDAIYWRATAIEVKRENDQIRAQVEDAKANSLACANCKCSLERSDAPLICGTCREMGAAPSLLQRAQELLSEADQLIKREGASDDARATANVLANGIEDLVKAMRGKRYSMSNPSTNRQADQ